MRFLFILKVALTARGATITASSGSLLDVSNAVASAVAGDTVSIPAGSNVWASPLTVSKAITIQGAGTNQTTIVGRAFLLIPGQDKLTRVTGIRFWNANWSTGEIIVPIGLCKQFRIDHCAFEKGHHAINIGYDSDGRHGANGPAYGVIDHNIFFDVNVSIYVADTETGDVEEGDAAWARGFSGAYAPGTTNTMCIEDNVFHTDRQITVALNNNNQHLYAWMGARATFRNNYQKSEGIGASEAMTSIDGHGQYAGSRSTMLFEIYSNRFDLAYGGQPFAHRGGSWVMHNNTITNGCSDYVELWNEQGTGDSTTGALTNTFFWGNTINGNAFASPLPLNATRPYTGHVNTNYWVAAPTNGQAFYPYTPLTYPHPLVAGAGGRPSAVGPLFMRRP